MITKSSKYNNGAANTEKFKKEKCVEQLAGHCLRKLQQAEIFQDEGKIERDEKNIDHHGPRTIPNIYHLADPPLLSSPITFK